MTKQQTGKQAVILAGGQGTRLRPYTTLMPKALVPLDDMPVLELVLRQLKNHGFTQITLTVGHLAQLIEAYFGNGESLGVNITYSREDQPLGTAGPLRVLANQLPDDFLVMNADIVSDINFHALFESHVQNKAEATIAVYRRTSKIDFGIIEFDPNTQQIDGFTEKPILEHSVSMGVYVFNKKVIELIPEKQLFGFDHLMKALIKSNEAGEKRPARVFPFNGYWLDIGRVDDYEKAVEDFQSMRETLLSAKAPVL